MPSKVRWELCSAFTICILSTVINTCFQTFALIDFFDFVRSYKFTIFRVNVLFYIDYFVELCYNITNNVHDILVN